MLIFFQKIINIPISSSKYGGKGMYGMHIHKGYSSNDKETGITIRYVSQEYDSGEIIFKKNNC